MAGKSVAQQIKIATTELKAAGLKAEALQTENERLKVIIYRLIKQHGGKLEMTYLSRDLADKVTSSYVMLSDGNEIRMYEDDSITNINRII